VKNIPVVVAIIVMYSMMLWASRGGPSPRVAQQEQHTTTLDSLLKLHHAADSTKDTMLLAPFLLPEWEDSVK